MSRLDVAPLAEPRCSGFEQLRVTGPMRLVAVEAVFHHRRVFPQEGPAALGVAFVAVLVVRAFDQLLWIRGSMWVMAACTGDLAFTKRHMGRAHQLGAVHLMALETNFHLRALDELAIFGQRLKEAAGSGRRLPDHYLVARHTGQAPRLVRASLPEQPHPFFMALQALGVLCVGGQA